MTADLAASLSGPSTRARTASALLALLALGSLLVGCGPLRPSPTPIPQVVVHDAEPARCLAVLLPGRHSRPEAFREAGFGEAVGERGLAMDVVAVDAHLGYYRKRTVVERLVADVLAPARGRGYDEVWVAGTSLGGLGGLLLLRDHPDAVAGVYAIAPFLGDDEVIAEIAAAGGPRRWQPPATIEEGDISRELWARLADSDWTAGAPLYLGWGRTDSLARSNAMLAELLPPERTFLDPGGHDLQTWNRLWEQFLDRVGPCRPAEPAES